MIARMYHKDASKDEDIEWITTKSGQHVPLKDGKAVGGPMKGKDFSKANSSQSKSNKKKVSKEDIEAKIDSLDDRYWNYQEKIELKGYEFEASTLAEIYDSIVGIREAIDDGEDEYLIDGWRDMTKADAFTKTVDDKIGEYLAYDYNDDTTVKAINVLVKLKDNIAKLYRMQE